MSNVKKPSLFFGLLIAVVFFIGFFLMASEVDNGEYLLYLGMLLGVLYWIWSIVLLILADDLKKYQKTFWLIIVVAVPFFGALLYNILHQTRNRMVA